MCGILGAIGPTGAIRDSVIVSALSTLRHRGPDDEGYAFLRPAQTVMEPYGGRDTPGSIPLRRLAETDASASVAALAFRRLSILDLSVAGHQPMSDPSGRFWLVFNGEIYNYLELRCDLERCGEVFRTGTDTEVLLTAWRIWGEDALRRFRGMFAFALLDLDRRTVALARDPFGIKPLYWTQQAGIFAFASEIKALLRFPGVRARADAEELYRFLRFGATEVDARSCFAGISQILPGHLVSVSLDTGSIVQSRPYREHHLLSETRDSSESLSERLSAVMRESVRLHLRSDVPVGSCFSGGLDSSLIMALARKEVGDTRLTGVCFDNRLAGISDAPFARSCGQTLDIDVEVIAPSPADLITDFDDLIYHQDVPFESTSIYAQYAVFRRAKQCGITVMLDGQGADELFGGYPTSISARMCEAFWRGDLNAVRLLANARSYPDAATRRRMLLAALGRVAPVALTGPLLGLIGEPLMLQEMNAKWFTDRGVLPRRRSEGRGRNALRDELVIQVRQWSLPHLLRYEDRNSMAFSIEARVPFCTTEVAEFAASLPSEQLISRRGETKAILRAAASSELPAKVIDRPKIGFTTDQSGWLKLAAPALRAEMSASRIDRLSALNPRVTRRRVLDALDRPIALPPDTWRLIMVAAWARRFDVAFD